MLVHTLQQNSASQNFAKYNHSFLDLQRKEARVNPDLMDKSKVHIDFQSLNPLMLFWSMEYMVVMGTP